MGLLVDRHALHCTRDVLTHGTGFQDALGGRERLCLTRTAPGGWRGKCHGGLWRILAQARKRQATAGEEHAGDEPKPTPSHAPGDFSRGPPHQALTHRFRLSLAGFVDDPFPWHDAVLSGVDPWGTDLVRARVLHRWREMPDEELIGRRTH